MKFAALIVLTACVSEREPPNRFVGTIEGSNALVFVVRDEIQTSAYASDGTVVPVVFDWFTVDSADTLSVTDDTGVSTLDIDFTTRTGALDGNAIVFEPIDEPFGLYRGSKTVDDRTYEVGIVLLDDRTQNGAIGITSTMTPGLTTIVSPRIVPEQTRITLLNDVSIELARQTTAFTR